MNKTHLVIGCFANVPNKTELHGFWTGNQFERTKILDNAKHLLTLAETIKKANQLSLVDKSNAWKPVELLIW